MIFCIFFSESENWKEEIGAVSNTDDSPSSSLKRKGKNSKSPVIRKIVKRRNLSKTSSDKHRPRLSSKSATEEDSVSVDLPAEKSGPGTFRCPFQSCGKLFRISLGKNMTKHLERSHRCSLKVQHHGTYDVIFFYNFGNFQGLKVLFHSVCIFFFFHFINSYSIVRKISAVVV
jgi:hypothetical protein